MKPWQVIMTDTAAGDLRGIALDIYEASGDSDTAIAFVQALREHCDVLFSLPETGAVPKDYVLKALGYRYLVYKHYLVFYVVDPAERKVFIHAFFNEKLDCFTIMR